MGCAWLWFGTLSLALAIDPSELAGWQSVYDWTKLGTFGDGCEGLAYHDPCLKCNIYAKCANDTIDTLSFSYFTSLQTFPSVRPFSHLRVLNLANNALVTMDFGVNDCTRLETLNLAYNRITTLLPIHITSLRVLNISSCRLEGTIPPSFFRLPSLEILDLSTQSLTDPFPTNISLPRLVTINLGYNAFDTLLDISDLTTLRSIRLNGNNIRYDLTNHTLFQFPNLTDLQLQNNRFSGTLPERLPPNLQLFDFSNNGFTGTVPHPGAEMVQMVGSQNRLTALPLLSAPKLHTLILFDNWEMEASFPDPSLLPALRVMDLGGTLLRGHFPPTSSLMNLTHIDVSNTQISGSLPQIGALTNLKVLQVEGGISGTIPRFGYLPSLSKLVMASSQLTGTIPELNGLVHLTRLVIGDNGLTGTIPSLVNCSATLEGLIIGKNALTGTIPNFAAFTQLSELVIRDNTLSGTLPLLPFSRLRYLMISSNHITGTFPRDLGYQTGMVVLDLSYNDLSGTLPQLDQMRMLFSLILSGNKFSGPLPSLPPKVRFLHLSNNKFSGPLTQLDSCPGLFQAFLHSNDFTGQIPTLKRWDRLQSLTLHGNRLEGSVPQLPDSLIKNVYHWNTSRLLTLHNNRLSCELPGRTDNFVPGLLSLVAPQNVFDGDNIPGWVSENERSASQLFVESPQTWVWMLIIAGCGPLLFGLAVWLYIPHRSATDQIRLVFNAFSVLWRCVSDGFSSDTDHVGMPTRVDPGIVLQFVTLISMACVAAFSIGLILPVYYVFGTRFECGRLLGRLSIAYTDGVASELSMSILLPAYSLLCGCCVLWVRGRGKSFYAHMPHLASPPFLSAHADTYQLLRWVVATGVWGLVMGILGLPLMLYDLFKVVPGDNRFELSPRTTTAFQFLTAPFILVSSVFILPKVCASVVQIAIPHSPEKVRLRLSLQLELLSRLGLIVLIPCFGVLVLDDNCFQFWKYVWGPCARGSAEFDFFVELPSVWHGIGAIQAISTEEICAVRYTADGRCPRRIAEVSSELVLGKMLFQAFLPTSSILLSHFFVRHLRPEYRVGKMFEWMLRSSLNRLNVLALTWMDIVVIYGCVSPLVTVAVSASFATHILTAYVLQRFSPGSVRESNVRPNFSWPVVGVVLQSLYVIWLMREASFQGSTVVMFVEVAVIGIISVTLVLWRRKNTRFHGMSSGEFIEPLRTYSNEIDAVSEE